MWLTYKDVFFFLSFFILSILLRHCLNSTPSPRQPQATTLATDCSPECNTSGVAVISQLSDKCMHRNEAFAISINLSIIEITACATTGVTMNRVVQLCTDNCLFHVWRCSDRDYKRDNIPIPHLACFNLSFVHEILYG